MDLTEFGEVLCAWSWYDCPRSGVAVFQGEPYQFLCEFSDELDDYPPEFHLWPADQYKLAADLALWNEWVAWRGRFDRGEVAGPFEHDSDVVERVAPTDAILAVLEWKLDPDRSFAERVPKHRVRWRRCES